MAINDAKSQIIENSIKNILSVFDDPKREGLVDTPKRVRKSLIELLTAEEPKITVFDSNGYDQMIVDKNIQYYTFCEHHILPFFGLIKIGYIPDKKIIGLSKLSRIAEYYSKRLNTQEYLTQNILNYLVEKLNPKGAGVIITGRHMCKEMRGVKKSGEMITSALHGVLLNNPQAKSEFLSF